MVVPRWRKKIRKKKEKQVAPPWRRNENFAESLLYDDVIEAKDAAGSVFGGNPSSFGSGILLGNYQVLPICATWAPRRNPLNTD